MSNEPLKDSSTMRPIAAPPLLPKSIQGQNPTQAEQDRRWRRILAPGKREKAHAKSEFKPGHVPPKSWAMPEIFYKIATLAESHGITRHNTRAGCWEVVINGEWALSLNLQETDQVNKKGVEVPPLAAYVEHNDFPTGVVGVTGGALMVGAEVDLMNALTNINSIKRS